MTVLERVYTLEGICSDFIGHTSTVLPGAEERGAGVQHRSLVSYLILLIPADLHSYLRSTSGHESSVMDKFCTQNAKYNMSFQICSYICSEQSANLRVANRFANGTTNLKIIFEVCSLDVKPIQCYLTPCSFFKLMASTEVSCTKC